MTPSVWRLVTWSSVYKMAERGGGGTTVRLRMGAYTYAIVPFLFVVFFVVHSLLTYHDKCERPCSLIAYIEQTNIEPEQVMKATCDHINCHDH